ncbi:jg24344 [Pararge aegeria aegeria]|uniref:Jg24344 protein n=1 Tax=Pararge aegeria aegeria TaxID=348720 RepID=A0A8S4QHU1_9NEOP|nr:jg24344 [Pararge aegeria aegeria]
MEKEIILGENARYSVRLESVYPEGAAAAFLIQPEVGYQRQTFFMTTTNHSMLDFEDENFRYGVKLQVTTDINIWFSIIHRSFFAYGTKIFKDTRPEGYTGPDREARWLSSSHIWEAPRSPKSAPVPPSAAHELVPGENIPPLYTDLPVFASDFFYTTTRQVTMKSKMVAAL